MVAMPFFTLVYKRKTVKLSLYTSWRRVVSRGTAPLIFNFCTIWSWMVDFTPWLLYLRGKTPRPHSVCGEVGPQTWSRRFSEMSLGPEGNHIKRCRTSHYTDWAINCEISHYRLKIPYPKCLGPEVFQISNFVIPAYYNETAWGSEPNLKARSINVTYIAYAHIGFI
jgi:hypothetical protein